MAEKNTVVAHLLGIVQQLTRNTSPSTLISRRLLTDGQTCRMNSRPALSPLFRPWAIRLCGLTGVTCLASWASSSIGTLPQKILDRSISPASEWQMGNSRGLVEGYFLNRRLTWKPASPSRLHTASEPGSGITFSASASASAEATLATRKPK